MFEKLLLYIEDLETSTIFLWLPTDKGNVSSPKLVICTYRKANKFIDACMKII